MKQKMARQFCQMESLKTTYQNAISLKLKFFAEPSYEIFEFENFESQYKKYLTTK